MAVWVIWPTVNLTTLPIVTRAILENSGSGVIPYGILWAKHLILSMDTSWDSLCNTAWNFHKHHGISMEFYGNNNGVFHMESQEIFMEKFYMFCP